MKKILRLLKDGGEILVDHGVGDNEVASRLARTLQKESFLVAGVSNDDGAALFELLNSAQGIESSGGKIDNNKGSLRRVPGGLGV